MQVYRGMDIGTAKADTATRERIAHHLIDLVEPAIDFSVAEFQRRGRLALADLERRGVIAVICGGSGLHLRSLVDPLEFPPTDPSIRARLEARDAADSRRRLLAADPGAGEHVDLDNPRRVVRALEVMEITGLTPSDRSRSPAARAVREYTPLAPFVAVGIDPGERLRPRIEQRFDAMLAGGLLDEVQRLLPRLGRVARQAVGYKELIPVVTGDRSLEEGRAAAIAATAALAKRQRTFFRRDPRIEWISWEDDASRRVAAVIDHLAEVGTWSL